MTEASRQISDMESALEAIEHDLLAASGDPQLFAKLQTRRQSMQREIDRLRYLERKETVESSAAHVRALEERFAEAVARARAIRDDEAVALDAQIMAARAHLDGLLVKAAELTREHAACASRSENAIAGLRKAGRVPPRPAISSHWACPGRDAALAFWQTAHAVLAASGLHPQGSAAISAVQVRRR